MVSDGSVSFASFLYPSMEFETSFRHERGFDEGDGRRSLRINTFMDAELYFRTDGKVFAAIIWCAIIL